VKKILEIKEIDSGILKVRLEATKRRTIWIKVLDKKVSNPCSGYCPLRGFDGECFKRRSPLHKYVIFADFCNRLFVEYPDLKDKLENGWGVKNIDQFIMWKRKRENH